MFETLSNGVNKYISLTSDGKILAEKIIYSGLQTQDTDEVRGLYYTVFKLDRISSEIKKYHGLFEDPDEEKFRDLFTISLNLCDNFKATRESKNKEGKTDMLIQSKNIEIPVEFKLWKGEKYIQQGVEQLINNTVYTQENNMFVTLLRDRSKNYEYYADKYRNILENMVCRDSIRAFNESISVFEEDMSEERKIYKIDTESGRNMNMGTLLFDMRGV